MRFLCLHGKGTSAVIFKSQTAPFRAKLDPTFSFDFIDGTCLSTPPPEIKHLYSPPFYSYWEGTKVADIKASFNLIREKLQSDGPYDGVLLFSQGAALLASFLLYLRADNQPSPFKFAIFICGGVHCSVLEDLGVQVSSEAHDWDKWMSTHLHTTVEASDTSEPGQSAASSDVIFDPNAPVDLHNLFGLDVLQPAIQKLRINIPTAHIYGNKDPTYPLSRQLVQLCDPTCRRVYDHGEGHGIPRKKEVSDRITALVKWAVEMVNDY